MPKRFSFALAVFCFSALSQLTAQSIYWANSSTDTIKKVLANGTGQQVMTPDLSQPPYGTSGGPWGVATYNDRVYMTEDNDKMLLGMDADGGNLSILASGSSVGSARDIHVYNDQLYWCTWEGYIRRSNLDGTGITTLASTGGFLQGIYVSALGIYYTDSTNKTLSRVNLDGTGASTLASSLNIPYGLWVDGSKIYFADLGTDAIYSCDLTGANLGVLISGLNNPSGLVVSGGRIYYTEQYVGLSSAAINGSDVQSIVTGETDARFLDLIAVPEPAQYSTLAASACLLAVILHRRYRREED